MNRIFFFAGILGIAFSTMAQPSLDGFQTHESGLRYKFNAKSDKGLPIQEGDIIIGTFAVAFGDSVVYNGLNGEPRPCFQASKRLEAFHGDLITGLQLMKVGEECVFAFPYDSIKKAQQLPPFFKPDEYCFFTVKIAKKQTQQEAMMEALQKQAEQQKIIDSLSKIEKQSIQDWLEKKKLKAEEIKGVYYIQTKEGSGELPKDGQMLSVNYVGRLLNGMLFDTSIESIAKAEHAVQPGRKYAPITFTLGKKQMIPGFETAAAQMKAGEQGTVVIPFSMGYGDRNMGNIPPYSTLVFDIEIVEIR